MELKQLNDIHNIDQDKTLRKRSTYLRNLLTELRKHEIPDDLIESINLQIDEINANSGTIKELKRKMLAFRKSTLKSVEKRLNLVPKGHYQTQWMAIGMLIFGIPMGYALQSSVDSMSIAIGIPIGMVIDMSVGAQKDKKAKQEGRQLDIKNPG